jgi:hypothetical protein
MYKFKDSLSEPPGINKAILQLFDQRYETTRKQSIYHIDDMVCVKDENNVKIAIVYEGNCFIFETHRIANKFDIDKFIEKMPDTVYDLDIIDITQSAWYEDKITTPITKFHMFLVEKILTQNQIHPEIINLMWNSYSWRCAINDHLETTHNKIILKTILNGNIDVSNYNNWSLRYFIQTNHEDLIQIIVKHPNMNLFKAMKEILCFTPDRVAWSKYIFYNKALGYKFLLLIMSSYQNPDYDSLWAILPRDIIVEILQKLL